MKSLRLILPIAVLPLTGCASPNLRKPDSYHAPAAPPIQQFFYNPFAAYGSANATWAPPVFDRNGTIVKPVEPASQGNRPDYEHAPWATGAAAGDGNRPPGTF
jgi:hypothetical protein